MPAQNCSTDLQTDAVSLPSPPPLANKLPALHVDAKEEEIEDVVAVVELKTKTETETETETEMKPPPPPIDDSCSPSLPPPPPEQDQKQEQEQEQEEGDAEEEKPSERVKEDSDSSRDAEQPLQEYAYVDLQAIRKEVQCPICLGVIKKTRTVMECLHRFCRECIDKSMRTGNKECPACRTHCASRRSLRDDPRYDTLIAMLFPDIESYEAEELAFCEEEKNRNKQIQASIAQIFKLQSEALGKKRPYRKGMSQRYNRGTPSRRSKRKRSGKSELESDADEDLENIEGQTSSYSGDLYTDTDQHRHTSRRRIGSSHSLSLPTSSGGACVENKLERKRSYPGVMWNIEMRAWGKYGDRSGHIRKKSQSARLVKLLEFLKNLEKEDDEHAISKSPAGTDKESVAANQSPEASQNKQDTIQLSTNTEEKGRLSEVVDQFRDRLQLSEEKKTLPGFEVNCISQGGQLLLACRQKEAL